MDENKKVAQLGQTVYLDENEDFDSVITPSVMKDPEEINFELPPVVPAKKVTLEKPVPGQSIKKTEEETKEDQQELAAEKVNQLIEDAMKAAKKEDDELEENKPFEFGTSAEKEIKIDLLNLEEDQEQEPIKEAEEKVNEPRKKAKSVDISKLKVVNKTEIDKERDLKNALYGNKAAFQIVAAQSGYMAKVLPLVHKDVINILYSNLGRYEYKKGVYRVIWEKIFDTSVGKMNFDEWLQRTSVEDMETFYYGVYCSTFPNEGSFRYTCPHCGNEKEYKINHRNLIKTTDREKMKRLIDEVSRNATTVQAMEAYSLIGKNEAIQLTESGIIIELRTPTLYDSLEILRTVPEKTIDKDTLSVTNMLYVNRLLVPSKDDKSVFVEETKRQSILRIIDNLPINDSKELEDAVYDRVDENRIMYSIKNIKCTECGEEVQDIPISIEDILFTLIFEKTQ